MKKLIPLAVIAVLLSSACLWTKRFELVDFDKKASDGRIELRASLNDTLFRIQDLRNYCRDSILALPNTDERWWFWGRDEFYSTRKGPKVTFTLINRTASKLSIPFDDLYIGRGTDTLFGWPDITVVLSAENKEIEDMYEARFIRFQCYDRKEEYFWDIAPGDSIVYYHPLDVFLYANEVYDSVHVDKYRVQIIYTSQCWKESDPVIWIGQARSQWLEFRVIEN